MKVKLFSFRVKLSDLWQYADAIPQHRPKRYVVCLHHFDHPMKFERNLDGRTRRETTANGDIAFLPADAPTRLRPVTNEPERFLSYSYLITKRDAIKTIVNTADTGSKRFSKPEPCLSPKETSS